MMVAYQDKNGNSGISHYEIGQDYIGVRFRLSHHVYLYKSKRVGKHHVERMKTLAQQGRGLSTYISQHPEVRDGYVLAESQMNRAFTPIESKNKR